MDAARKLLVDTLTRRPDLDLKNLSLAIGRNHAYLQQYLMRGSPRELPEAARLVLAPLLGVTPDALRASSPLIGEDLSLDGDMPGLFTTDESDLPVYGSAQGDGNWMTITSANPVDFVRRPEPLLSARGGYGCHVIDDTMSPAFERGDLLLVHPDRPVRPGDDCLFVQESENRLQRVQLKRLLRIASESWEVRQFNPPLDFDLDRGEWQKVQLVVGKYSR